MSLSLRLVFPAMLLLAATALAQSAPVGGELQVNTVATGFQGFPAVAMAPGTDSDFVVVWESSPSIDASSDGIRLQLFAADGTPVGGESQVNTYTTGVQKRPAVAIEPGGEMLVVWESEGSAGDDVGSRSIQAWASGAPAGGEFQVNTYTPYAQSSGAVAASPNGDFVVVWASRGSAGPDTSSGSIQGRIFASDATPRTGEFQVNTYTLSYQSYPAVATAPNGDFVVVWHSDGTLGSDVQPPSVQAQRFNPAGAPLGGEFQVNSHTTNAQRFPAVAVAPGGEILMVWQSLGSAGADNSSTSIQGRLFNSVGVAVGEDFQINTFTPSTQATPSVAVGDGRQFVVTWQSDGSSDSDSSSYSIQRQDLAADATAVGGELQVNTSTAADQWYPAVAPGRGGRFVVVWATYDPATSSYSIEGQRMVQPHYVFADGFESGDTSAWSSSVP